MKKCIAFVALVVVAGWSAGANDDAAKAAKKLEGKYEVLEAIRAGKPEPKAADIKSFTIKDGEIVIDDGQREEKATFKLDPSKKPTEIDLSPPGKDKVVKGIYQIEETDKGLELTLAFTRDGERPKNFDGKGNDEMVLKLLRKK